MSAPRIIPIGALDEIKRPYAEGETMPERSAESRELKAFANEVLLYHQVLKAMAEATTCPVCGCWVIRKVGGVGIRTCSPECATLWRDIRYRVDDDAREEQRRRSARSILRNPDRYLSKPPNRRFEIGGSCPARAVERARELRGEAS